MPLLLMLLLTFQTTLPKGMPPPPKMPPYRGPSFYPHPPEPLHLEEYQLDITFEVKVKHWFWTSTKPVHQGRIRMEQARPKGGWWVAQVRDTAVDGRIAGPIQLDSIWPHKVLFILLDDKGTQLAAAETEAKDKKINGRVLLQ